MKVLTALALGILLGGTGTWLRLRAPLTPTLVAAKDPDRPPLAVVAAAQGRIEGRTENIEVEASADGVVRSLNVREGQRVAQGAVIGELACDPLDAEVRASESQRESAKQARLRLLRGSRDEERRVADEEVRAAKAVMEQAERHHTRMQYLASKDDVPAQSAENARRDLETARAAFSAAAEKQKLANAGPLPEEIAKADADVAAAEEQLRAAMARRDRCIVRAPITGTITRVNMRVGEAFSTVLPRPIVTMADLGTRRIRAEVDERDIAKVRLQQPVRISAEGIQQPFGGTVTWTSVVMGRRTARSTDPAEKADRDILETIVTPGPGAPVLPLGLRVTVEFLQN